MAPLPLREKLAILSDAAKYDASCASSGAASVTTGSALRREARSRIASAHPAGGVAAVSSK